MTADDTKEEEPRTDAKAIVVSGWGMSISMSQSAFDKFANAGPWLFPGRDARATVTKATAQRAADLIAGRVTERTPLDDLIEQAVRTQIGRESNVKAVIEGTGHLLDKGHVLTPDRQLPSGADAAQGATMPEWFAQWRRGAEDATTDSMRTMYATLLAGELESPGVFSMRTLSVVRDMDQRAANFFKALEPHTLIGGAAVPSLKHLVTTTAFQVHRHEADRHDGFARCRPYLLGARRDHRRATHPVG